MTMIGAIGLDGFGDFMSIDAATDTDVFRAFVRHELVRNLLPGLVFSSSRSSCSARGIDSPPVATSALAGPLAGERSTVTRRAGADGQPRAIENL